MVLAVIKINQKPNLKNQNHKLKTFKPVFLIFGLRFWSLIFAFWFLNKKQRLFGLIIKYYNKTFYKSIACISPVNPI